MAEDIKPTQKNSSDDQYISMLEASKLCSYSQEYLSLLARRGRIEAKKMGRNWFVTRGALNEYLQRQSVVISLPKNFFAHHNAPTEFKTDKFGKPVLVASLAATEQSQITPTPKSKLYEEFLRMNAEPISEAPATPSQPFVLPPQKVLQNQNSNLPVPLAQVAIPPKPAPVLPHTLAKEHPLQVHERVRDNKFETTIDKLANSISQLTQKVSTPSALRPDQEEFIEIESQSLGHRFRRVRSFYSNFPKHPQRLTAIVVAAFALLFILVGGFAFGNADYVAEQIRNVFKDADTIQGHFPGTHANEVLVLDKTGKIAIFGHIETEGQLRSHAPNGVAPIVVDSMTKIENLNADYLDDLSTKDFTLAFVTKNGNVTYEDVKLEGNVEIGKTLTLKGPLKLLDELLVYGGLGVFSDAVFSKEVKLTGGSLKIENGNLVIGKGTIEISNTNLVKNLNAEFWNGKSQGDFTLDYVVGQGNSTNKVAFFNGGLYGGSGAFSSIGVAGGASIGSQATQNSNNFTVYANKFTLDANGNLSTSGTATVQNLVVPNSVASNLIPSGSRDLGSAANPWERLYVVSGSFENITVSGNLILPASVSLSSSGTGIAGIDVREGAGNFALVSSLTFDASMFDISTIASESIVKLDWINGPASRAANQTITGFWNFANSVSVSSNFEVSGYASSSQLFGSGLSACGAGNKLLWSGGMFSCVGDTSASAFQVREFPGGSTISSVATISFEAGHFNITASGSNDAVVKLDWTNGPASRAANETITGIWRFTNSASISPNLEVIGGYASISNTLWVNTVAGNVGIGTSNPQALLHVNGATGIQLTAPTAVTANITTTAGGVQVDQAFAATTFLDHGNANNSFDLGTGNYQTLSGAITITPGFSLGGGTFRVNDDGTTTDATPFFIGTTGNVGIGTTSPAVKLQVVGNASVSGNFEISGYASASQLFGATLSTCAATQNLQWLDGRFTCVTTQTSAGQSQFGIRESGGTFTNRSSISFEAGNFNITFPTSTEALVKLDWGSGGPASLSQNEVVTGFWNFSNNVSISGNLEVSSYASVSQLFGATLATCTSTQNLQWLNGRFTCVSTQTGPGFSQIGIRETGSTFNNRSSLSFEAGNFNVTFPNSTEAFVKLDWTNGPASRTANETITGNWNFTNSVSVSSNLEVIGGYASISNTLMVNRPGFAGNVGIGTSTPGNRLDIVGPVQNEVYVVRIDATANGQAGNQHGLTINGTDGASTLISAGQTTITRQPPYLRVDGAVNGNYAATINNSGGSGYGLKIDAATYGLIVNTGAVGIGDASPEQKLTIAGNILASASGNVDLILKSTSANGDDGKFAIRSATTNERLDILNGAGTTLVSIASAGAIQVGNTTPAVYSRFGTSATTHATDVNANNDVLISGDLEVDGRAYFDGGIVFSQPSSASGDFEVGGQVLLADGSAPAPSLTFKLDKDTGLYRIGNDVFGISTGGAERLRFSTSGTSGSFPIEATTFKGATYTGDAGVSLLSGGANALVIDTGGAATLTLGNTNASVLIIGRSGVTTQFADDIRIDGADIKDSTGAARITFTSTGGGGILQLIGDVDATKHIKSGDELISAGVGQFGNTATASHSRFGASGTTHSNFISTPSDLLISGDLEVDATAAFDSFLRVGTSTLFADPSIGRVGIGTITPGAGLQVENSSSGGIIILSRGGTSNLTFTGNNGSQTIAGNGLLNISASDVNVWNNLGVGSGNNTPNEVLDVRGNITASTSGSVDLILNSTGNQDGKFIIRSTSVGRLDILGSASQNYLTIASSGNIGIGTTTPGSRLTVAGNTALNGSASVSVNFEVVGFASHAQVFGAAYTSCNGTTGKLLWNSTSGLFFCGIDQTTGGGGGNMEVREYPTGFGGNVSTISFDPAHFQLTASGSNDVIVKLDWGAGGPASKGANQTVTGIWTFSNRTSISGNFEVADNKFFVRQSTGQVGIGTKNLTETLEVFGNASISGELNLFGAIEIAKGTAADVAYSRLGTAATGRGLSTAADLLLSSLLEVDGQAYFDAGASVASNFEVGSSRFYVDSSNTRVGIGTQNLTESLEVVGNASLSGDIRVNGNDIFDSTGTARLTFDTDGDRIVFTGNASLSGTFEGAGTVKASTFTGDGAVTLKSSGGQSLSLEAPSGALNIGADSQTSSITVSHTGVVTVFNDDIRVLGNDIQDSGSVTRITLGPTVTVTGNLSVTGGTLVAQNASISGNFEVGTNKFYVESSTGRVGIGTQSLSEILELAGNASISGNIYAFGNIGIGTSNPTTQLQVVGNASVSAIFEVGNRASVSALVGSAFTGISNCNTESLTLLWDSTTGRFSCGVDSGASGSNLSVREFPGTEFIGRATISFDANHFSLTASGSNDVSIKLDWANGPASRSADETITGFWRFTAASTQLTGLELVNNASIGGNIVVSGNVSVSRNFEANESIILDKSAANDNIALDLRVVGTSRIKLNPYDAGTASRIIFNNSASIIENIGGGLVFNAVGGDTLFREGGNSFVAFTTTQRVGVGDVSPEAKFEVSGGEASLSNTLFVQDVGNVGIGTTAPQTKLEVVGTASASAYTGVAFSSITSNCNLETQTLLWDSTTGTFLCGADAGASGGNVRTEEGGTTIVQNSSVINFEPNQFSLTASNSSETIVRLDWANGPASRAADETITGFWKFTAASTQLTGLELMNNASVGGNITLNGTNSGQTFSGTGTHLIQASAGTLQLGAFTLAGLVTGNSQNIIGVNNVSGSGTFEAPTIKATTFTGDGAVTILSNATNTLRLDTGGSGTINIGDTNAAAINIGRNTITTNIVDDLRVSGGDIKDSTTQERISFLTNGFAGLTQFIGYASFSQGLEVAGNLIGNTSLQVAGTIPLAYSRFGVGTATHTGSITQANDVFITGDLEIDGSASFDGFVGFTNASASGTFEAATNLIANNVLQVGGTTATAYSRFGTNTTNRGLSTSFDVLISGKLEVDGDAWFDSHASVSGNLEVAGIISGYSISSNASISGNLDVTGQIHAANGSAALPSYTFDSDQNTGIFRKGTDSFSITAGGIEGLNVTSTTASLSNALYTSGGNVGIGTITPNTGLVVGRGSLEVQSSHDTISAPGSWTNIGSDAGLFLSYDSTRNNARLAAVRSGVGYDDIFFTGASFSFTTGSTERVRIDNNGNVGIGVNFASPIDSKLEVGGTASISGKSRIHNTLQIQGSRETITDANSSTGDTGGMLEFAYDSTNNKALIRSVQWAVSFQPLYFQANEFRWATGTGGPAEKMLLDVNGNLGIGTTSLTDKFELVGAASISGKLSLWNSASVSLNVEALGYSSASATFGSGLTNCANPVTDKLIWALATGKFACATDSGSGGLGMVQVRELGVFDEPTAATISFEPSQFSLAASQGNPALNDVIVRLDWGAGGPASLSQDETVLGFWIFDNNVSVSSPFILEVASTIKAVSYTGDAAVSVLSGGNNTLRLDAGGSGVVNIGDQNATAVNIGRTGITTTVNGSLSGPSATLSVLGNASISINFEAVGNLIANGVLQTGGTTFVAYNRIGTNVTSHANLINSNSDLLISGDLEVDGTVNFEGIASASLFYAGNGTAASPSFSFRADQDGGMFRPAVNQLGFSTLGVERLRINSTGSVGIGDSSPESFFTVAGNILASASGPTDIILRSFGPANPASNDGKFTIRASGSFGSDTLQILNGANTSLVTVSSNGFVGFGATDPDLNVVIVNNDVISNQLRLRSQRAAIVAGNIIGGLDFMSNDTQLTAPGIKVAQIQALAAGTHSTTILTTDLAFFTTTGAGFNEKMRITGAGSVGIWDTTPDATFEVVATGSGDILNVTSNGGSDGDYLTIENLGDVGIGITNPTAKFHIANIVPVTTVTTGTGTAAANIMTVSGSWGGNTNDSDGTAIGGAGSAVLFTGGTGGVANLATISNTGGAGGAFTFTGGRGGSATVVGATTNTGGAGGAVTIAGGAGGAANGGVTNNGGAGGLLTLNGGAAATATGSAGGGVTIAAAAGSNTGTGGAGGALTLTAGAAQGNQLVNRQGGLLSMTTGVSTGNLAGGAWTVTGGNAGQNAADRDGTAAGVTGGLFTLTMGAGGFTPVATVSATGGAGGTFTITGGAGGAQSVAGIGTNTGGSGSPFTWTSGAGGAATGATSGVNQGGAGGLITFTAGTGGAANTSSVRNLGGAGGAITIRAGTGGIGTNQGGNGGLLTLGGGTSAVSSGSAGGGVTITGAAGPATATIASGGNGGTITLTAGAATGTGLVNRTGGALTMTAGVSTGSASGGAWTVTTGASGATLGAGTQTGGAGGAITFTMGAGGTAPNASVRSNGGAAGTFTITGGVGGAAAGSGLNIGGAGSPFSWIAGTGGASTLGTRNQGGDGGAVTLRAGAGGAGSNQGGNGGLLTLGGGLSVAGSGSAGGGVTITGQAGASTVASGGNGGALTFTGGAATGVGRVNRTGGSLTMTAGVSTGSASGGAWTVTTGASGATLGTGTQTGGTGGLITLTMGAGGTAPNAEILSTGGTGGAFTITGGVGGAAAATGSGNNTGGAGSLFSWIAGTGGTANGATSGTNTGGAGGAITIRAGTGGAATNGTDFGGAGGVFTVQAGTGGAGSGAKTGVGGNLQLNGGISGTNSGGVQSGGGHIIFQTAATTALTEAARITSGSFVGIGTTAPFSKLDLTDAVGGTFTLSRNDTAAVGDDLIGKLQFWNNDANLTTQNLFATIEAHATGTIGTDAATGYLSFYTTSATLAGAPIERMRITDTGNIGIGEVSPQVKLDIRGTASASYLIAASALNAGRVSNVATTSYSRFGISTTTHSGSVSAADDLLISGDLEVDGFALFDGGVSVSSNFEVSGYASVSSLFGSGLTSCVTGNKLLWSSGLFSCASDPSGSAFQVREFPGGSTVSNVATISFEAGYFNIAASGSNDVVVKLDWINGPASRAAAQTISGIWNFMGGELGIGTISPDYTLEIVSASTNFAIRSTDAAASISFNFFPAGGASSSNQAAFTLRAGGSGGAGERLDLINGADATIMSIASSGRIGLGERAGTSLVGKFHLEGSVLTSGATAVGGYFASISLSNSTVSGFQFGNRFLNNVVGGTAGTSVGQFIRMTDNTALSNTVRGLEVQAFSGTNTAGINTGIAAFGKTFGVQGTTDALAGGVSVPAGIFADLDNGSAPTAGNALRAYTDNATSANLVQFYHEVSAFTGTGLLMNFGNNAGTYTGRYIDLQKAGTSQFSIISTASAGIAAKLGVGSMYRVDATSSTSFVLDGNAVGTNGYSQLSIGRDQGSAGAGLGVLGFHNSNSGIATADKRLAAIVGSTDTANIASGTLSFWTAPRAGALTERLRIMPNGNIGIGTSNVDAKFEVFSTATTTSVASISAVSLTTGNAFEIRVPVSSSFSGAAFLVRDTNNVIWASLSSGGRLSIRRSLFAHQAVVANCTGVGTPVSGCVDVAENYPTNDLTLEAGDVIAVDASRSQGVRRATHRDGVLGIVSSNPGVLLTGGSVIMGNDTSIPSVANNVPIALSGRVPVKVSLENGPITAGDHLMLSSTFPGYAARATEAGMTIGIALEAVQSEGQKVMTFVNLDYWAPTTAGLSVVTTSSISSNISSGSITVTSTGGIDILGTIAQATEVIMKKVRVTGDIIAQGAKKTYFAFAEALPSIDPSTWATRSTTISVTAPDEVKALFQGTAAQAADQSKIDLIEDNGNYLATYGVDSTRGEIQLSGTSDLINGEAKVFFDESFTAIISHTLPIRVLITPTSNSIQGQLYIDTKNQFGFIVKELNGSSSGKFDWLVIARRKGFDGDVLITPTPSPAGSGSPASPTTTPIPETSPTETPTSSPIPTESVSPSPEISSTPSPTPEVLTTPDPVSEIIPTPTLEPTLIP